MAEPSDNELIQLLAGKLDPAREGEISEQLSGDEALQRRLERLSGSAEFADDFDSTGYEDRTAPIGGRSYGDFLDANDRLGKFEFLEEIGRGGAGTVLKARDPDLDRVVAIKWLNSADALSDEMRERFSRESMAVAAIENPHVLPVFSVEEVEGVPFLVSRYVEGETLESLIGKLEIEEAIRIGIAVAEALEAAHQAGVIHRDLKPSNVMIEKETGHVWLMDFGLAKAESSSLHTREGMLLGTPHYMSPEQAKGWKVDARSDLFSLGVVLFELLSGRQPFSSDHISAVLWQVTESPPPDLRKLAPSTPRWLVNLIEQLLEKSADNRPRSAGEVAEVLRSGSFSKKSASRRRTILIGGVVSAAVAIVVGVFLKGEFSSEREPSREPGAGPEPAARFRIEGFSEAFATLEEAVSAAVPESIIEIEADGPVRAPVLSLTKILTFRGAAGFSPELEFSADPENPAIQTDSNLRLENLTLRYFSDSPTPVPFLSVERGNLSVDRCRFEIPGREWNGSKGLAPMFLFRGSGEVKVSNCAFLSPYAAGFFFDPTGDHRRDLRIRNCVIFLRNLLSIRQNNSTSELDLEMRDTVVSCRQVFNFGSAGASEAKEIPTIRVLMQRNIFDASQSLIVVGQIGVENFYEKLQWRGNQNRYSIGMDFIEARRGGRLLPANFSQWKASLPQGEESGSGSFSRTFVNSISSPPIDAVLLRLDGQLAEDLLLARFCRLNLEEVGPQPAE